MATVNDPLQNGLSTCGCEGTTAPIVARGNRSGLPAIAYRSGDHGTFLARMRGRVPDQEVPPGDAVGAQPLASLSPGASSGDASDAVLDAAATALDVLTFYAERFANEGYLRTATERRSLLALARAIGYELRPGVAASVYLAFTVEDAAGSPGAATVRAGSPVQSIPTKQGETPQTFETSADLEARAEWNALHPRTTREQPLFTGAETLLLAGTALDLSKGDLLLIAAPGATADDPPQTRVGAVTAVSEEPERDRTRIDVANAEPGPPPPPPPPPPLTFAPVLLKYQAMTQDNVSGLIVGQSWHESDLNTFMTIQKWEPQKIVANVQYHITQLVAPKPPLPDAEVGVFAFRDRLGIFGSNAPRWNTLPAAQRFGEWVINADGDSEFVDPAYPNDWDTNRPPITGDSEDTFLLERVVPTLRPNTWLVLGAPGVDFHPYRVATVSERSISDFGITAKSSVLQVAEATDLATFTMRETTAHVDSEPFALAPLPIEEPLAEGKTTIELDRLVLGLNPGRPLLLTGERADLPGVTESEVLVLAEAVHTDGRTVLTFSSGLAGSYILASVTLNANVVLATHGETISEVLGSGDGSQSNQEFSLRSPPLTYVTADTASGTSTTLQVRVDRVLWDEVPYLYNSPPETHRFVVRLEDDGTIRIIGGDGDQGARFPTGLENVSAVYRSGIGLSGQVGTGQLTLMPRRPLGIREVTNPLAAAGAADPESRDDARANAPLTVRTMERIVSLSDYEDFARAFAGVGKAQAVALRKGATRLVHVTIAGAGGAEVPTSAPLLENLVAAVHRLGDPWQRFLIEGFDARFFRAQARLRLDTPRLIAADVLADAKQALLAAFSFARRDFGQSVTSAEVIAVLQSVPGVVSVDLDALHLIAEGIETGTLVDIIPAHSARWEDPRPEQDNDTILRGELLLISPVGAELTERIGPG